MARETGPDYGNALCDTMGSSIGYFEIAQEPGSNFIPRIFTELTQENVKPQKVQFPFLSLSATPAGNGKKPTTKTSIAIRYRGVKYAHDTRGLS